MKTLTPEAAAARFHKLSETNPVKAHQFRDAFEVSASEQDYEDFRYALSNLETYGVC